MIRINMIKNMIKHIIKDNMIKLEMINIFKNVVIKIFPTMINNFKNVIMKNKINTF